MKIEIILETDVDEKIPEILEHWNEIKDSLMGYFKIEEAKLIFDKAVKEIDLSKY